MEKVKPAELALARGLKMAVNVGYSIRARDSERGRKESDRLTSANAVCCSFAGVAGSPIYGK